MQDFSVSNNVREKHPKDCVTWRAISHEGAALHEEEMKMKLEDASERKLDLTT